MSDDFEVKETEGRTVVRRADGSGIELKMDVTRPEKYLERTAPAEHSGDTENASDG